jgi:6-phosphofructokinase
MHTVVMLHMYPLVVAHRRFKHVLAKVCGYEARGPHQHNFDQAQINVLAHRCVHLQIQELRHTQPINALKSLLSLSLNTFHSIVSKYAHKN